MDMTRFEDNDGGFLIRHYDGLNDYATLRKPNSKNQAVYDDTEGYIKSGKSWMGVDTLEELEAAVRNGWTDGLARIQETLDSIDVDVRPTSIKRRTSRGDQGDDYDVHRAMSGGLDKAWSRRSRQARTGSAGGVVTIAVALTLDGGQDSSTQFWRGAACVKIADALTAAGYQVEIVAYHPSGNSFSNSKGTPNSLKLVAAKEAHMPLDLVALTTLVALAGTTRYYSFLNYCHENLAVNINLGQAMHHYRLKGADICIAGNDVHDKATAEKFIRASLASIDSRAQRLAA